MVETAFSRMESSFMCSWTVYLHATKVYSDVIGPEIIWVFICRYRWIEIAIIVINNLMIISLLDLVWGDVHAAAEKHKMLNLH